MKTSEGDILEHLEKALSREKWLAQELQQLKQKMAQAKNQRAVQANDPGALVCGVAGR